MAVRTLTGTRLRARRIDLGLRQADLARQAGISASYLNLIEHNRRRIGGKLLTDLAQVLGLDPSHLAEATGAALISALRLAAATSPEPVDLTRIEDVAVRFPDWAALIAAQTGQIDRLQTRVRDLSDRLTHDPDLAAALHAVLSAVTSIRSTASILVNSDAIDRDWQDRFHRNLFDDARKLAEQARSLVDYLERPQDPVGLGSPIEGLSHWLAQYGYHSPHAEQGLPAGGPTGPVADAAFARYHADALALPLAAFGPAAKALGYDPAALAGLTGRGLATVLRRLASLPEPEHPPMGLAICDAAGAITLLKPTDGFSLPLLTPGCPLWPLYLALGQPGRGVSADVVLAGVKLRCLAVAEVLDAGFDGPGRVEAVMLVQQGGAGTVTVGPTCRLCPREHCPARREPSILG